MDRSDIVIHIYLDLHLIFDLLGDVEAAWQVLELLNQLRHRALRIGEVLLYLIGLHRVQRAIEPLALPPLPVRRREP